MEKEKEYVVTEKQLDDLGLFARDFNEYRHELFDVGMWAGDWGDIERGFSLGGTYRELERSCDKMSSMLDEIESGYNQISMSTSTYTITQKELEELTYFAVEFKVIAEDIDNIPIDEGNSMRIGYELGYIHSNLLHNFTSLLILINNIKKNIRGKDNSSHENVEVPNESKEVDEIMNRFLNGWMSHIKSK